MLSQSGYMLVQLKVRHSMVQLPKPAVLLCQLGLGLMDSLLISCLDLSR